MKTGDILLFDEHPTNCCMNFLDSCIKCCTQSSYSHSAFVLVDPPFGPKGTFVWESSYHGTKDPQDDKVKFGVQLTPLSLYTKRYPGSVSIYRRTSSYEFSDKDIMRIHAKVYDKPYDIIPTDWIHALFHIPMHRRTDTFYCSAFVSYILTQVGILSSDTDWTIVSPEDLSSSGTFLKWNISYSPDVVYKDCGDL